MKKRICAIALAVTFALCCVLAAGCSSKNGVKTGSAAGEKTETAKKTGRTDKTGESATASSSGDGTDAKEAGDAGKAGSGAEDDGTSKANDGKKTGTDGGTSKARDDDANTGTRDDGKKTGGETRDDGTNTGGGTSGGTSGKHTHKYVKTTETVHVDEQGHWEDVLVKAAWTEEVPVYKMQEVVVSICNVKGCNAELASQKEADEHSKQHALKYEGGGWHTELRMKQVQTGVNKVEHPAEYQKQWVVDVPAHDETVTVYKCSCGAKKEK